MEEYSAPARELLALMDVSLWLPLAAAGDSGYPVSQAGNALSAPSGKTASDNPVVPASAAAASGSSAPPLANSSAASTALAALPPELESLRVRVAGCTACPLHAGRAQTVFGVGNPQADWMFVGEGPGEEEDRRGEPFVGRAGKLLDNMLRAMKLDRSTVYIANVVKCHPPGNRNPSLEESAACLPYLHRQIELIAPRLIVALGAVAAQRLLDSSETVGSMHGCFWPHTDCISTAFTPSSPWPRTSAPPSGWKRGTW